jgi:hypothetical protein
VQDNPQPRLLKEAAEQIDEPLAVILGMSLTSRVIPSDWKQANIKPIFKKGRKDKASNYCPISLTSIACKVLESIINDALVSHLERNQSL